MLCFVCWVYTDPVYSFLQYWLEHGAARIIKNILCLVNCRGCLFTEKRTRRLSQEALMGYRAGVSAESDFALHVHHYLTLVFTKNWKTYCMCRYTFDLYHPTQPLFVIQIDEIRSIFSQLMPIDSSRYFLWFLNIGHKCLMAFTLVAWHNLGPCPRWKHINLPKMKIRACLADNKQNHLTFQSYHMDFLSKQINERKYPSYVIVVQDVVKCELQNGYSLTFPHSDLSTPFVFFALRRHNYENNF